MNDIKILMNYQNTIGRKELDDLCELVERYYHFSSSRFLMWKMFQFGFAYGKRAERARRKNK